jgi:hypothetical protein
MKKTLITLALLSAGSAQANLLTNTFILLDGATERNSLAPSILSSGDATGILNLHMDTQGALFNGGTITGSYQFYANTASGFGPHINTYTNVTYTLGTSSGTILDFNYNGTGTWLAEYRFGGDWNNLGNGTASDATRDINAWSTVSQAPVSSLRNNNGAAVATNGSMSCAGASCSPWGNNSFGLEGLVIQLNVDQNHGFTVLGGSVKMMEFTGINGIAQTQIEGYIGAPCLSGDPYCGTNNYVAPSIVPVPASVWLMGSGLLSLAGVARRKKSLP